MPKNVLQILAERGSKSPKMIEAWKLEREKYLKETEEREKNAQKDRIEGS